MSRIRSVHPGFFTDEDLVSVSMGARLLFIGLGIEADDKGIFEWKPTTIKMRIFPADNIDVAALLTQLEEVGAIKKFEIADRAFGAIRNFRKFQKPKTPNDIHPATDEILAFVGLPISETSSGNVVPFPPKGEKPFQMEDGGGRREDEEETPSGVCASDDALTPAEIVEDWNLLAEQCGLPKVKRLSDERKRKLRVRLRQYPDIEDWQTAFNHIRTTPFLRGENKEGWRADFDFLLQARSFTKLTEESYGKAN